MTLGPAHFLRVGFGILAVGAAIAVLPLFAGQSLGLAAVASLATALLVLALGEWMTRRGTTAAAIAIEQRRDR